MRKISKVMVDSLMTDGETWWTAKRLKVYVIDLWTQTDRWQICHKDRYLQCMMIHPNLIESTKLLYPRARFIRNPKHFPIDVIRAIFL